MAALVLAVGFPGQAWSLELKNVRPIYGPLGTVRTDAKFLPGDFIYMTYDIEELKVDVKTRKASLVTIVEFLDNKNTVQFQRETPMEVVLSLGGDRVPGELNLLIQTQQSPGKYKVRLRVTDRLAKQSKSYEYPFEVIAPSFGIIGVLSPAIGVPGQRAHVQFALVNMKLDAKKLPKVEVTMRVLDDEGKALSLPLKQLLPRDLPEEVKSLEKENFVPLLFPIYLNRPGRFTLAIDAFDQLATRKTELRVPLTVLDLSKFGGK